MNQLDVEAEPPLRNLSAAARAGMVNRTHRVVRERARALQASRSRARSLLLPLLLCSSLMLMLFAALWMLLGQYDLVSELPDSTRHFLMMLLWFVPVSGALVAMVWLRRGRNPGDTSSEASG